MKILVTGFEPFGGETINPSYEAVRLLPEVIAGAEIVKAELPTVFGKSAELLTDLIREHSPTVVLCVGQAGGRSAMTPERVAINVDDAIIPDNAQQQPLEVSIQSDGPAAYFTKLPIKAMVKAMQDAGIPAQVSNTAGTFVCNHIMYQLLYMTEHEFKAENIRAGFLHIPYMTEQVANKPEEPSLPLETICKGIELAIAAIIHHKESDIGLVIGALD